MSDNRSGEIPPGVIRYTNAAALPPASARPASAPASARPASAPASARPASGPPVDPPEGAPPGRWVRRPFQPSGNLSQDSQYSLGAGAEVYRQEVEYNRNPTYVWEPTITNKSKPKPAASPASPQRYASPASPQGYASPASPQGYASPASPLPGPQARGFLGRLYNRARGRAPASASAGPTYQSPAVGQLRNELARQIEEGNKVIANIKSTLDRIEGMLPKQGGTRRRKRKVNRTFKR